MRYTQPQTFYHGSMTKLPVGTVLTPRDDYENDWSGTDFYAALEYWRPDSMLSHSQSVFMVADEDDVDLAGGGTEWLFIVEPEGRIERHDINWGSEVSMLIGDGHEIESESVKKAALQYWWGTPHSSNESVWEYLTPKAKIIHVERY
jgi:hypothetical protein